MTFAGESGPFSTLDLPSLPGYGRRLLSYNANELTLSVAGTPTPEPGGLLGALGLFLPGWAAWFAIGYELA
jgi:hypothetical protein